MIKALEQAKQTGYVVGGSQSWRLFNAYFHWCCANARPYVRVRRLNSRHAEVELDLIGCPRGCRLNREQVGAIRELLQDATTRRPGERRPVLYSGANWCHSNRVALDLAEQVAAEIYAITSCGEGEHDGPLVEHLHQSGGVWAR